jgi:hypothetical protein
VSSAAVPTPSKLTQFLILTVAAIGFLFDTYELLMLPVIAGPALAELLQLPANNPLVTAWVGRLLWMAALCGGVFGLLGGFLIDRFGRKTVMVASILLYSLSPVAAAFSTDLGWFVFFRCATFVGVCVEFVAAITWLAELFPDKRSKELAIGWTQAFASVGGLLVTGANQLAVMYADQLPAIPVREPFDPHASWRYTLITGLVPGILILFLLPFVPESRVWLERKRAGTLKRPRFGELFTPELRRVTLVSTALSACAYAAAFGALQMTPTRIVPGLPELEEQRKILQPLQAEAKGLNEKLAEVRPALAAEFTAVPGLEEAVNNRTALRREFRKLQEVKTEESRARVEEVRSALVTSTDRIEELTAGRPEAKAAVQAWDITLGQIGANRAKQKDADDAVKAKGNTYQFWQEMGGLTGRILLALLVVSIASRRLLLQIFQVPGLVLFPVTYYLLFRNQPDLLLYGIFFCGLVTVAQFSYFGEYLPKAFPLHLRGTGGSFATNVGGRMIGTSAALLNTELIAKLIPGPTFVQVATAAAIIGGGVYLIGLLLSFFLPEPKAEATE